MLLGQPAFLDGEVSLRGWWSYFPRALAMKSTPVELLLAVVALAGMMSPRTDVALRLWRCSIAVLGALAIASPLDTGVRYVLVLYPLVILCGVDALAVWARARDRWAFAVVAGALVMFQGASAWSIAPRQLSYFNALFGGPERGHLHLVDSNLDWGQDLPALRDAAARLGIRDLRLAYFGTAPPEAYGVAALPWADDGEPGEEAWLAVSATYLHGLYLGGDPFAELRGIEPDARAGYGIFVYDLRRPEVRRAYLTARAASRSLPPPAISARTHSTG